MVRGWGCGMRRSWRGGGSGTGFVFYPRFGEGGLRFRPGYDMVHWTISALEGGLLFRLIPASAGHGGCGAISANWL